MANLDKEIKVIAVKGERGYSSYEEAVRNGLFVGTLEEWINSFLTPENYVTNTTFQNAIQNLITEKLNKNSIGDQRNIYITNENGILNIKTTDDVDYTMELKFEQASIQLVYKEYSGGVVVETKTYFLQSYLDKVDTLESSVDTLESNVGTLTPKVATLEEEMEVLIPKVNDLEEIITAVEDIPIIDNTASITKTGLYAISIEDDYGNYSYTVMMSIYDLSKEVRSRTINAYTSGTTYYLSMVYTPYKINNEYAGIIHLSTDFHVVDTMAHCKLIREY